MRKTFKVHKITKTIYLPKDIREEGFDDKMDGYMNAVTLTLVKPGVDLDLAIESLRGVIQDLELRRKAGITKAPAALVHNNENHKEHEGFNELRQKLKGGV